MKLCHNGNELTRVVELLRGVQTLAVGAAIADISGAEDGVDGFMEDGSAADVTGGNSRSSA